MPEVVKLETGYMSREENAHMVMPLYILSLRELASAGYRPRVPGGVMQRPPQAMASGS